MTGRTFPAFPPRRGAVRGRTWWGRAWTQAMEETSLDQGRLARGRTYARAGRVGPITVSPGRISAPVYGSHAVPYQTTVYVERLGEPDWERFLAEVAARAGHIAALLDGDMPHDLVAAAADAGVRLLPTVGDLEPECGCPDWGYPCKHAAALCYQAAWLLDEDPFVLLLMRGRGQSELLEGLRRRDAPAVADLVPAAGTPAAEAYAATPAPLPDRGPPPDGPPAELVVPEGPGVDPAALRLLVADAAVRARGLLAGDAPVLTEWQDTVRFAAIHPDRYPRPDLAREVAAWRYGGLAGLQTLAEPWTPPKLDMARARAGLAADGEQFPELREWRNRWTVPGRGVQLRYGRDGRWYPYRQRSDDHSAPGPRSGARWWPAGPPDRDPGAVLADLLSETP
ncbi:MAG TPA: SWIM zinc finger family protein [Micromonosporaceae bacterium]